MSPIVHRTRPAAGDPVGALVLLHGRGADELDLAPCSTSSTRRSASSGSRPAAPSRFRPAAPTGTSVEEVGFPDPDTFLPTFTEVSEWLDSTLAEAGIAPERTVLGGFSQGTVMSYALGLAASRPRPAAILAMSGFIPTVEGFELDLEERAGMPVSISHGTYDPVIGVEFGREARDLPR